MPYSRAKRFLLILAAALIVGGIAGAFLYARLREETAKPPVIASDGGQASFLLADIPAYSGEPACEVNGNRPFFTEEEIPAKPYPTYAVYGELDALGRCTTAEACLSEELMPTEERTSIQNVRPTGWHTVKYAGIDKNYLYNRCHLIAFILAGENDNGRNLITGTRYLNTEGMEPYELEVMSYLYRTGNHVRYRVTPVFENNNLVASGVLMEAYSLEDRGKGICYCIYCYNVQPGVTIDYATGESEGPPLE